MARPSIHAATWPAFERSGCMLIRRGRMALTDLSRIGVVLLPRRSRSAWVGSSVALIVAALAGAAAHHVHGRLQASPSSSLSSSPSFQADALNDVQRREQTIERTGLQLRVAEARALELERQIDILNQRLHASQEEVTFFRKAVNGKR